MGKSTYQARKAMGKCVRCGVKADDKYTECLTCRMDSRLKEEKRRKNQDIMPRTLMSRECFNPYDYSTAADYARLSGYHRTTIAKWIRQGKIIARNKAIKANSENHNRHWKITHKDMMKPIKKENPKTGTNWNKTERYVLLNNIDSPLDELQKLIPNRTRNAITVMRCRMKNKKREFWQ